MKRVVSLFLCLLFCMLSLTCYSESQNESPTDVSWQSFVDSYNTIKAYAPNPLDETYYNLLVGALELPIYSISVVQWREYYDAHQTTIGVETNETLKRLNHILVEEASACYESGIYEPGVIDRVLGFNFEPDVDYVSDMTWLSTLLDEYEQEKDAQSSAALAETIDFDYAAFSRNPENYAGQSVKVSGKVIQVMGSRSSGYDIRLATNGSSDIVYITVYSSYVPDSNILEDDELTIYGTFIGDYTYKTVLGSSVTLPRVSAKLVEFASLNDNEQESVAQAFEPEVWFDQGGVKITCIGYGYKEGYSTPYLEFDFIVENNGQTEMWAGFDDDSVNDWAMGTGGNFCDNGLLPGKKLKTKQTVYLTNCEVESIEDIEKYEFDMWVDLNTDSYDDERIIVHKVITEFSVMPEE